MAQGDAIGHPSLLPGRFLLVGIVERRTPNHEKGLEIG